jgi:D-amino peptidase
MKIYISADIEGVTGTTHWDETDLAKPDYAPFREQMTAEVVAACEGALEAGATEIWIKDAHDSARNLIAARLPHEARLIRGWASSPFMMVQELDDTFRAVLLIGYHSRAGSGSSPLAHTMTGSFVHMRLNGRYASELLFSAYAAASVHVPVAFLSGDRGLCDEVTEFQPAIATVAVKEGIGGSTVNIHPDLATARIREGVARALKSDLDRAQIPLPDHFTLELRYRDQAKAYTFGFYPGARQIDAVTVQFEADDYFDVLRALMFMT